MDGRDRYDEPWYGSNVETRITWIWYPRKGRPLPGHILWNRSQPESGMDRFKVRVDQPFPAHWVWGDAALLHMINDETKAGVYDEETADRIVAGLNERFESAVVTKVAVAAGVEPATSALTAPRSTD